MSNLEKQSKCTLRYSLLGLFCVVSGLSVVWALVPLAALITIGAMPIAVGFGVFMIGDQRENDGLVATGLTLVAVGFGVGAVLMCVVQGLAP